MKHYYCKSKFNILKNLKIKTFFVFFILFYPTILNARTVGNYIGIDLVKTNLSFSTEEFMYSSKKGISVDKSVQTDPSSAYSFGLKYNYALNYRGFFIAPGLIYENNNTKNYFNRSTKNAESQNNFFGKSYSKINKRYGIKIDIGADINEDFSIYGTIGQAINYYQSYGSLYYDYYNDKKHDYNEPYIENSWKLSKGKKIAPFFGGGFRIKINKNWLLNGEYSYTRFTIDTKNKDQFQLIIYDNPEEAIKKYYNNNINIFKLGINFNF